MHDHQSLSALALLLAAAVGMGLLLNRLRMPAAAGFILVGMALGPSGMRLIATSDNIETLAQMGVLMLLFIIGMEMRLAAFSKSLPLALGVTGVTCAVIPISVALFTYAVHGEVLGGVVIGFMLSISSTAVAMKMIEDSEEKDTKAGRLAVAILVAQDLAVVPLLLITNTLGGALTAKALIGVGSKLALAFALLGLFIHVLNKVKSFRFPASQYLLKNFDIGTLGVLGICFASAAASGFMGLSPALGAFLGGLAVGHSTLRRGALRMAQPIQSILLFIFFLSVGLLIDLHYLVQQVWVIGAALVVVTGGKTVLNFILLTLGGKNFDTAFAASLFLSPVGEFSFVIAGAGLAAGTLSPAGHKLAIAVIAMSLLASPIFFLLARLAHRLAVKHLGFTMPPTDLAAAVPALQGPGE
jgi:CPA2 family monovalent cation:H+ antiporter-2